MLKEGFLISMYHPTKWSLSGISNCSKFVFIPMPHFKDGCYGHPMCKKKVHGGCFYASEGSDS